MMSFLTSLKVKLFGNSLEELETQNSTLLSCLSHLE